MNHQHELPLSPNLYIKKGFKDRVLSPSTYLARNGVQSFSSVCVCVWGVAPFSLSFLFPIFSLKARRRTCHLFKKGEETFFTHVKI